MSAPSSHNLQSAHPSRQFLPGGWTCCLNEPSLWWEDVVGSPAFHIVPGLESGGGSPWGGCWGGEGDWSWREGLGRVRQLVQLTAGVGQVEPQGRDFSRLTTGWVHIVQQETFLLLQNLHQLVHLPLLCNDPVDPPVTLGDGGLLGAALVNRVIRHARR